jgi:hypothetical protein
VYAVFATLGPTYAILSYCLKFNTKRIYTFTWIEDIIDDDEEIDKRTDNQQRVKLRHKDPNSSNWALNVTFKYPWFLYCMHSFEDTQANGDIKVSSKFTDRTYALRVSDKLFHQLTSSVRIDLKDDLLQDKLFHIASNFNTININSSEWTIEAQHTAIFTFHFLKNLQLQLPPVPFQASLVVPM